MPSLAFDPEFIRLQVRFASRVASSAALSLPDALLRYTNLYVRLGAGRDFDPSHPLWRRYVEGLSRAEDPCRYSSSFYLAEQPETHTAPTTVARFGCFSYAALSLEGDPHQQVGSRPNRLPSQPEASAPTSNHLLRLHFRNTEVASRSPFCREQLPRRQAELLALLLHAREHYSADTLVLGSSWLYQLPAYRSLFPRCFVDRLQDVPTRPQSMSCWGQFLSHDRSVKRPLASQFGARVAAATSIPQLLESFPLRTLSAQATLRELSTPERGAPGKSS